MLLSCSFLSTLRAGAICGAAAELPVMSTGVDAVRAAEVLAAIAGSKAAILSSGEGGVCNGSSISIGDVKTLLSGSLIFSFLLASSAAGEAAWWPP